VHQLLINPDPQFKNDYENEHFFQGNNTMELNAMIFGYQ